MRTRRACTADGIGLTGIGDCRNGLQRRYCNQLSLKTGSGQARHTGALSLSAMPPIPTELMRRAETSRCANSGRSASQQNATPDDRGNIYRGWRAPLPRRKSTNPPADSCDREMTLCGPKCSRLLLSLENRSTLIPAVTAELPGLLRRAACASEIAVIGAP